MNKTLWEKFLKEATDVNKPMSRVEKQKAALRLKMARSKLQSQENSDPPEKVNQTLSENFYLIYKYISSGVTEKRIERKEKSQKSLVNVYSSGLLENTPLSEIKLKTFIGAGVFSAAFEDDSGHIIKCGIIRDKTSEEEFYQKFASTPTKDFVVFYFKAIPVPGTPNEKLYIAITNKFLTFFEYAEYIRSSSSKPSLASIPNLAWPEKFGQLFGRFRKDDSWKMGKLFLIRDYMTRRKIEVNPKNILSTWGSIDKDEVTKDITDYKKELLNTFGISYKDSTKILDEILKIFSEQKVPDVHLKNLGVNVVSGMGNPSFFYFDR